MSLSGEPGRVSVAKKGRRGGHSPTRRMRILANRSLVSEFWYFCDQKYNRTFAVKVAKENFAVKVTTNNFTLKVEKIICKKSHKSIADFFRTLQEI